MGPTGAPTEIAAKETVLLAGGGLGNAVLFSIGAALALADLLRGKNCRLTRIAQGLPAGGGLEHADELTLRRAMQGRRGVF